MRPLVLPCIGPAGAIRATLTEIIVDGSAIFARNSVGADGGMSIRRLDRPLFGVRARVKCND